MSALRISVKSLQLGLGALALSLVPWLFGQNQTHELPHTIGAQLPPPGNGPGWPNKAIGQWKVDTDADFASWLADLKIWRTEHLARMGYDDSQYRRPELLWAQKNFIQTQMMVEERYFYDPVAGRYTVNRFLDDVDKRYGGLDSVLIWQVYPNAGIDNRNLWDLMRDLPGGLSALRQVVADFHRRNVRVFIPMMPWDRGTRDEGLTDWDATARLAAELGADGVNGDTFKGVPRTYRTASDATGHPVVFEAENPPWADEGLMWNNQSWGYWDFGFFPTPSKVKWLERRHLINLEDRWARDKTDDLQFAFFNGIGYLAWENVWGIWNGITPRDSEALRRVATVEREFADLLVSPEWEPYTPAIQRGVFASKFPLGGRTLWTFVNRNEYDIVDEQLSLVAVEGRRYFDVWSGRELTPRTSGGLVFLSFPMERHGFGSVLAVDRGTEMARLEFHLEKMRQMTQQPLSYYSRDWTLCPNRS
jgi:iron(II)-dependent oxidoreductase